MSASLYSAIRTRLVTATVSWLGAEPGGPSSTTASPVITSCWRPRSSRSIRAASARSRGLPSRRPSRTTSVSAPSTTAGAHAAPMSAATARALASATAAMAWAGGTGGCSSGMWLARTWNGMPRCPSSSRRRGEAEAVQMRVAVPVAELLGIQALRDEAVDVGGGLLPGVGALGGQDEAPRGPKAGDEALVRRDHREDFLERAVHRPVEEDLVHLGHAGLHGHNPLVGQPVTDQGVELLGEEQAGRPFLEGLHQIHHDQVEALVGLLEIGPGVLVQQPGPGVVEGALVHLGQVLLALLDHLTVDVHHEAVGDRLVAQDLPDRGPLAPADDHGPLGPRVGQEARVHQGLVVDELVGLAR